MFQHIPLYKYKDFLEKVVEKGCIEQSGATKLIFRCPICGDSKKNLRKKRGYLLTSSDGKATIGCLNCDYTSSFYHFLKVNYPNLHKDWLLDVLFSDSKYIEKEEEFVTENLFMDYSQYLSLKDKSHPLVRKLALDLINKRRLPKHIVKNWLYCAEGEYANRLIIPYYMRDGSFKYFEARDLTGKSFMKYKFPKAMPQEFYNMAFIDKTRDFFVFEGVADSTFVENSCSTGGASKLGRFLNEIDAKFHKNVVIVFDGDSDGIKKSYTMLKRGFRVFVWNSEMMSYAKDCKIDMNQLIMCGFFDKVLDEKGQIPYEEIMKYVYIPSLPNMLDFELYYSDLGYEIEGKKHAKFVQRDGKETIKASGNTRKSGSGKRFHR